VSKHTHTALKEAAQKLAAAEGLNHAEAHRIVSRWAAHEGPTDAEVEAADAATAGFDPLFYYASQPPSEIPGFLMRMGSDYPQLRSEGPAPYCHPHPVQSLANSEQETVLSLTARPDVFDYLPALVVEPLTYTPPTDGRVPPGYGYWGNCWSVELYDVGFRYNRVSNLAAPGWSATVTRGPEPSAPCHLRVAHEGGFVLFDAPTPLPPDWLVRTRVHAEGLPVFCGPCAGAPVPQRLDDEQVDMLLETADLTVARIPFTVQEA